MKCASQSSAATARTDVDQAIEGLCRAVGATNDSRLGKMLGVSRAAVGQWRRRGFVPKSAFLKLQRLERLGLIGFGVGEEARVLGHAVTGLGTRLAILIAPSRDSIATGRFSPFEYERVLRAYADLFPAIQLAASEAIASRAAAIGASEEDALADLAKAEPGELFARLMMEARGHVSAVAGEAK